MGSDEFDQHAAKRVRDVNDQSILVPAEIEDNAIVTYEVDGATELTLDIARALPPCLCNHCVPCARWTFRLPMSLPELLERSASDHLHKAWIACHQIGDKACQDRSATSNPASFHTVCRSGRFSAAMRSSAALRALLVAITAA